MFGFSDEEHDDAVPADRFDKMAWNGMRMESMAIDKMVNDLKKDYDYVEDFTQDVFSLLSKSFPRVRAAEEMKADHVPLREVTDELSNLPEVERLREHTVGDAFNAAMALGSMKDVIKESLERAKELQKQAEEAQDLADAANAAAAAQDPNAQGAADAASAAASALQAAAASNAAQGRSAMRAAATAAGDDIEEMQEAASAYGMDAGDFQRMPFSERLALAKKLSGSKLKRFAQLIGQFKQLAAAEHRRRFTDGADEVVGVKLGNDLTRLTTEEQINLCLPEMEEDFWRRYAASELRVYETRGRERAGKGPIIVVGDESASMAGSGEMWMKGLTLALLDQAHRGKRDFHYIGFGSDHDKLRTFAFPGGASTMDQVIDLAEGFINGGTSFVKPISEALSLVVKAGKVRPDVVFITDGDGHLTDQLIKDWKGLREALSVKCYGIQIGGRPTQQLLDLSDNVRYVGDLLDVTQAADILRT